MAVNADNVVTLSDGRALGYAECGDPGGAVVLHFHGTPSSRLELMTPEFDFLAGRAGVRLLSIDRPGMGLSDPKPGRGILDWPVDVVGFAEGLGLSRFSVLGTSGGCPYALACAQRIPHRLRSVGVVAGLAPMTEPQVRAGMSPAGRRLFFFGRYFPWLLHQLLKRMAQRLVSGSEQWLNEQLRQAPPADREVAARPGARAHGLNVARSAFRKGAEGPLEDVRLASRPWGFELGQVPMIVNIWFGGQDTAVPAPAGRYLANALQRSESRFYPEEGHLSIIWNRFEEILTGLLATADREAGKPV